jgi:hypothetical protein
MSLVNLRAAVMQAFGDAGLDIATAVEGAPFTPPDVTTPWARTLLLPVNRDSRLATVDRVAVLLQVDLFYPSGRGTRAIEEAVQTVLDYFEPRRRFTFDGQGVFVRTRDTTGIRPGDGRLGVTVTISFNAVVEHAA